MYHSISDRHRQKENYHYQQSACFGVASNVTDKRYTHAYGRSMHTIRNAAERAVSARKSVGRKGGKKGEGADRDSQ